jgi:flagellar hook-associated protein 3 FlgL
VKLSHISSQSIAAALRHSIAGMQKDMLTAQKEATTGHLADASLTLGAKNGRLVSLTKDAERLSAILDTNARVTGRLKFAQQVIGQISGLGQNLIVTLTGAAGGGVDPAITVAAARLALEDLTGALNTAFDGDYIFAGVNTDAQPIVKYENSATSAAVNTAFQTYFGFAKTDPQAGLITAAQMDSFITAEVEPLFMGANWNGSISSASDEGVRSRISLSEITETSISANETGFRKAMFGAALAAEFFEGSLGAAARSAVAQRSMTEVSESVGSLAVLQGRKGFTLQKIEEASNRLTLQSDYLSSMAEDLSAVDPFEASTRLNSLLTQIETSYAISARIQNLSFLKFMP